MWRVSCNFWLHGTLHGMGVARVFRHLTVLFAPLLLLCCGAPALLGGNAAVACKSIEGCCSVRHQQGHMV
jgi:hypothetical protein